MLSASYLRVTFTRKHVLQIEGGLRFLLPGEGNLRDRRQPISQLRFRRFADGAGRIDGALGDRDLSAKAGQAEKRALDAEDDLLVLAIEAKVGC